LLQTDNQVCVLSGILIKISKDVLDKYPAEKIEQKIDMGIGIL
jgi:hypothetical protein